MGVRPWSPAAVAAIGRMAKVQSGPFRFGQRTADSLSKVHERGWRPWIEHHFPDKSQFARRHVRLWEWFAQLVPGVKPPARVEVWPRGGAKSSTAELGATFAGVSGRRKFALYVSGTQQSQANKHVQAIGRNLDVVGCRRAIDRYGNSLGWRMDMLRVAGGFNVLALGLDAAARGIKLDDFRPDLIILDDIDDRLDSPRTIEKKLTTLAETILPTGAPDAAVLVIQNRIHADSIVSRLVDGRADFLHNREVYQEPAVEDLEIDADLKPDGSRRYRIVGGRPTWSGQPLDVCEGQLNEWGRAAFFREAQHDVTEIDVGLWNRARDIDPFRLPREGTPVPRREDLVRIVVAIDPNTTGTGDDAGIVVAGARQVHGLWHAYILEDATVSEGPLSWARAAVSAYNRWQATTLVAESNNGGEMVRVTIQTVSGAPQVKLISASRGKATRAEPVQKLAEEGRVHHCGVFMELERELCTWRLGDPSPNRLDAMVWSVTELILAPAGIGSAPVRLG